MSPLNGVHALPGPAHDPGAYPRVYRNLMCVGLLGVVYRLAEDARLVNDAVERTLDDPQPFRLVHAVALGLAGQPEHGRDALALGMHNEPADDAQRMALAMAQLFGGNPEWHYWVEQVLACSIDQPARQAAYGVLAFVRSLARRMH